MSTETYSRSRPSARRLMSGLFAGAWYIEVLLLMATLVVGFGVGILLNSFLLGFAAVLVFAVVVLVVLTQLRPPTAPSSRKDPLQPPSPRHGPDRSHVGSR